MILFGFSLAVTIWDLNFKKKNLDYYINLDLGFNFIYKKIIILIPVTFIRLYVIQVNYSILTKLINIKIQPNLIGGVSIKKGGKKGRGNL